MSASGRTHRRRIGEILVNEGLISAEQLDEALNIQRKTGELLGTILMDMGLVAEADIAKTICSQYQLPFICLANYDFDEKLVSLFPKEFLHRHKLFPFDRVGETLLVLVTEIPQETVTEEIPKLTKLNAALYVGYATEVMHQLATLVPLVTAPPVAATAPARAAARAEPEETAAEGAEEPRGTTLVFGSSKESFLEELDSTWDSIFQQVQSTAEPPKPPPPKPRK